MRLRTLVLLLLFCSAAFASDFSLGIKLYNDGLYSLAAKTFSENLGNISPEAFKKFYPYMYGAFLKSGNFKALKELVNYWETNFPDFKSGQLLALENLLAIHGGEPIQEVINKNEFSKLTIDDKIGFFKALSDASLSSDNLLYLLSISSKDTDMKGAVKESGFLEKTLQTAIKRNDYQLMDSIFDNYGRWFSSPQEVLEYVKYLERKKQISEALIEAEKLYRKYPSNSVRTELAKAYYLNGNYKRALQTLKPLNTEEAKYLKVWCYFKLGHPEKIPEIIGLNVSKPEIPAKLNVLLNFFRCNFNFEKLKRLYPELYPKSYIYSFQTDLPDKVGSYHDLGYIYYERGLYKEATSYLEKAVQNPSNKRLLPRTLYLLGKLGSLNTEVASVVYTQLMNSFQNTPFYSEAIVPAARAYLYSGNSALAVKLLKYAESQLGLKTDEVNKLLGIAYTNEGDYKDGVYYLSKVSLKDGDTYTLLAFDLFQMGKRGDAYNFLKNGLSSKGLYPEVNGGRLVYLSKILHRKPNFNSLSIASPTVQLMAAISSKDVEKVKALLPQVFRNAKLAAALFLSITYEKSSPTEAMNYLTVIANLSTDETVSNFARQMINFLAFKSNNFEPVLLNDPLFIAYNPENGITSLDTLISKAEDYISTQEYGKAYGLLKLALERTSSDKIRNEIVEKLVDIDLAKKSYSKALKDVELVQNNTPSEKDIKNFLKFKVFLTSGRLVDAYTAAQSIKDTNNIPKWERNSFLAKLANYYKLTGNKGKAANIVDTLVNSGNLSAVDYDDLVKLAIFAQDEGKLDEAQNLINEAMRKAKTAEQKVESLFWEASIQAEKGDTDGAILNYMKINYEYGNVEPWASTSLYRAAQLFEKSGNYKQALKLYRKVVKMKRGTKEGEIATEKVKSLLQRMGRENVP